ncbi:MAG: helix-turn-helix domain-containing protein [Candidatus Aenigmatarchaeota archaeon]
MTKFDKNTYCDTMINFACKNIEPKELIKCSFQIKESEYEVLLHLLEGKEESVKTITDSLKLERSTVQKALQNLVNKELVKKRQRNLENGGYMYVYKSKDKEKIKKEITNLMKKWVNKAKKTIRKI